MGVKGLTTFFNQNPGLSKPFQLHDCSVIIDGSNLKHSIYFKSKISPVCGGDYNKYAASIRKYFSRFLECNIRPIIVLDGGYDRSNHKLNTVLRRTRDRLTVTQHIAKYGDCSQKVLPIMASEVFRLIVLEMKIPYVQCDFEADDQITSLANYYECPVISNDSDFYIFDVHHGFIRLDSLKLRVETCEISSTRSFKCLKCDIYYIDEFLSYFPGIKKNILPLFGSLVGNDFIDERIFNSFFSHIRLPKHKTGKLIIRPQQKRIIGLLHWLSNSDLNEAITHVLNHLKEHKRSLAKALISGSIDSYSVSNCSLVCIIDGRTNDLMHELKLESRLTNACGTVLPMDFIVQFHEGIFPPDFLNVIFHHRVLFGAQVEDDSLESSYACSRFIRQVLYGILLHHDSQGSVCKNPECIRHVLEYDREGNGLRMISVEPLFTVNNIGCVPKLNALNSFKTDHLQSFILKVLGCDMNVIQRVYEKWKLLVSCIIYWLKNYHTYPRREFVYALIVNILYFSVINEPSSPSMPSSLCNGNTPAEDNMSRLVSVVTQSEVLFASKNLKKYLEMPVFNNAQPLNLHIVHSYSQFQTCFLATTHLNKLLRCAFQMPGAHKCFSGSMIYNLTKDFLSRRLPEMFISLILGEESNLSKLFIKLKDIVFDCVPADVFMEGNIARSRKGKKAKRRSAKNKPAKSEEVKVHDPDICLNAGNDQHDIFEEEDDDDDVNVYI